MGRSELSGSEWGTVQTALEWYIDDRLENAKLTPDDDDRQTHLQAAQKAEVLLARLMARVE